MQVWTNHDLNGPIDSYDYDIHELDDNSLVLSNSSSIEWTRPDEQRAVLVDDGDSIEITVENKIIELNYEEQVIVLSLLMAHYKDKIELREIKTIKSL